MTAWKVPHHPALKGVDCSNCALVRVCTRYKNTAWVSLPPEKQESLDEMPCQFFVYHKPGTPREGEKTLKAGGRP